VRLVLVEWIDSFGCSNKWAVLSEDFSPPSVPLCRSVGWLFYDGDDCKVVVPHMAEATNCSERQGCGDMTIPSRAIVRLVDLALPSPGLALDESPLQRPH
jgi:hypothetical protein